VFHKHAGVGMSGVSVFFAADDENWALDVGDVIDGTQLRSGHAEAPLQLVQQKRSQHPAEHSKVIFQAIARCDFNSRINFLEYQRIDFQRRSCQQSRDSAQRTSKDGNAMYWVHVTHEVDGGEHIATFFPAKRNVIAFRFTSCLEVNQ
jgi:hypothetical protein